MDQPIIPELPKPSFAKWPLIAFFAFLLGVASVLAYQKYLPARSNPAAPFPSPFVSPALSEVEQAPDLNEIDCNTSSDCPGGYFCNTFDGVCRQALPD